MLVNVSVLEVPLEFQGLRNDGSLDLDKWGNSKLKDNMFLTAHPLYKNMDVDFEKLEEIVKSDYRQISPFNYMNNTKKTEKWDNSKQNLFIIDIDDNMPITEAQKIFKQYKYLLYTTKSHQQEKKGLNCDRYRMIFPATNIPRGDKYFDVMRVVEKKYPFIDTQVNNKTGAFLGNFNCKVLINDGISMDFSFFSEIKTGLEELEKIAFKKDIEVPNKQINNKSNDLPIQEIKNRLTREIVADIISGCGYEVGRNFMFKARKEEKTASASISNECVVKDFGNQEAYSDIFGFLQYHENMNFIESVRYVGRFTNVQVA